MLTLLGLALCAFTLLAADADAASKRKSKPAQRKKPAAAVLAPAYAFRPEAQSFIAEMVREHQFDDAALQTVFKQVRKNERVITLMDAPARRPAMWHEYIGRFTTPERINEGVAFAKTHADVLAQAEAQYGVPAHVIVAIIGVETFYGRVTGGFSVLDALATLAFDYPRRAEFFRGELKHFLLLNRSTPNVLLTAKGSYAGAMGLPQFMPGSYRNYAVDFDQDGQTDLWGSPADIIGSVGAYLQQHGWKRAQPVWSSLDGMDLSALPAIDGGLSVRQPVRVLREAKVPTVDSVPDDSEAAVLMLEMLDGPRYFVAYNNWYVITRYNRSRLYASAVWTLAESIRGKM